MELNNYPHIACEWSLSLDTNTAVKCGRSKCDGLKILINQWERKKNHKTRNYLKQYVEPWWCFGIFSAFTRNRWNRTKRPEIFTLFIFMCNKIVFSESRSFLIDWSKSETLENLKMCDNLHLWHRLAILFVRTANVTTKKETNILYASIFKSHKRFWFGFKFLKLVFGWTLSF